MDYANGTRQEWQFDNRKRIRHIRVTGPGDAVIEELAYTLNGVGDILGINDNEYGYDGFGRLVDARTLVPGSEDLLKRVARYFGTYQNGDPIRGVSYSAEADFNTDGRVNGADHLYAIRNTSEDAYDQERFGYDRAGNRVWLEQNGDELRYEYGKRNRLQRIYCKEQGQGSERLAAEYLYDENGNTICRKVYEGAEVESTVFGYDELNQLITTEQDGKESEYAYDPAGNRFLKKGPDGELTLYLRHGQIAVAMEVEVAPSGDTEYKGKVSRYVLSGDLLAGRITTTVYPDDSTTVAKSWYHLDHLNSTKAVSDEAGAVEVRYEYRAFGEQLARLGEGEATYTYSGKELDEATNLYYFNARYYDPAIGRFITLDPVQDGSNWYVYCDNNPLSMVDPTGLDPNYYEWRTVSKATFLLDYRGLESLKEGLRKEVSDALSPNLSDVGGVFSKLLSAFSSMSRWQAGELHRDENAIEDVLLEHKESLKSGETYVEVHSQVEIMEYPDGVGHERFDNFVRRVTNTLDVINSETGESILPEPLALSRESQTINIAEENSYAQEREAFLYTAD
jgi:RHS repeat-associated protein